VRLGILIALVFVFGIAYVAWLVRQCVCTSAQWRRLEKETCKRVWEEDREEGMRVLVPERPSVNPPLKKRKSDTPSSPRSPAGSGGV